MTRFPVTRYLDKVNQQQCKQNHSQLATLFKILCRVCQVIEFQNHNIFEGRRMCKEVFVERVIFENSPKLCQQFVENFENNTGVENPRHFSLLNLAFQLKLKVNKAHFSHGCRSHSMSIGDSAIALTYSLNSD